MTASTTRKVQYLNYIKNDLREGDYVRYLRPSGKKISGYLLYYSRNNKKAVIETHSGARFTFPTLKGYTRRVKELNRSERDGTKSRKLDKVKGTTQNHVKNDHSGVALNTQSHAFQKNSSSESCQCIGTHAEQVTPLGESSHQCHGCTALQQKVEELTKKLKRLETFFVSEETPASLSSDSSSNQEEKPSLNSSRAEKRRNYRRARRNRAKEIKRAGLGFVRPEDPSDRYLQPQTSEVVQSGFQSPVSDFVDTTSSSTSLPCSWPLDPDMKARRLLSEVQQPLKVYANIRRIKSCPGVSCYGCDQAVAELLNLNVLPTSKEEFDCLYHFLAKRYDPYELPLDRYSPTNFWKISKSGTNACQTYMSGGKR